MKNRMLCLLMFISLVFNMTGCASPVVMVEEDGGFEEEAEASINPDTLPAGDSDSVVDALQQKKK